MSAKRINEVLDTRPKILDGTVEECVLENISFRENVVYSKGVSDSEVERACRLAGIDHFIRTLPQGYDTVLNDKASLSAGQKQLLTIARAMVENARC